MPVWHDAIQELRRDGAVEVLGITQEQHPARCELFARWQGLDWPILWDPLNLTGARAVPAVLAIDEFGIVRHDRLDPRRVEEQLVDGFLAATFEAPRPGASRDGGPRVTRADRSARAGDAQAAESDPVAHAYARLLWGEAAELDGALDTLEAAGLDPERADPAALFRAGVAYRMRVDSSHARPDDFQRALDLWSAALHRDPNQYIWRRRIQQYGPRLDKPYPFYDWIERAQAALRERGQPAVELPVPLSGTEVAEPSRTYPSLLDGAGAPDPERRVDVDEGQWVGIESAAAAHTASAGPRVRQRPSARVHLTLRPNPARRVHWSNDAGPTRVWIAVPQGWGIERNLFELPVPERETSDEVRRLDFEITPPAGWRGPAKLRGYALYYVCEGVSGTCLYRRQDFVVSVPG